MKKEISKEELDTYLKYLDIALKSDIEDINNFSRSDILRLEKAMIINLYNLKKYDNKILRKRKELDLMYHRQDALNWQVRATEEDIINNLSSKLINGMAGVTLISLIGTSDGYEIIKRLAILLGIYLFTFKLNLLYFTSDKRREIVHKKISLLEKKIINDERYYKLYQGISKSFSEKLEKQYDKILELCPEINEDEIKIKRRK